MSTSVPITTSAVTVTDNGSTVAVSVASSAVSVNAGVVGPQGATGPGVAAGGSTGQVLVKASGTDYDTSWTSSPTFGTATMTLGTATTLQAGTATLAAASIGSVSNAEIQYLDGLTEPLTTSLAGKVATADLPYHVVIPGIVLPSATQSFSSQIYVASAIYNCLALTFTTQNGFLEWTFSCAAGTYSLKTIWRASTDQAILSISIDGGAALGTTIDTYAAATSYNNITDITGLTLAAGRHTIRYTGATKNASSTGYRVPLQGFSFTRTGA